MTDKVHRIFKYDFQILSSNVEAAKILYNLSKGLFLQQANLLGWDLGFLVKPLEIHNRVRMVTPPAQLTEISLDTPWMKAKQSKLHMNVSTRWARLACMKSRTLCMPMLQDVAYKVLRHSNTSSNYGQQTDCYYETLMVEISDSV